MSAIDRSSVAQVLAPNVLKSLAEQISDGSGRLHSAMVEAHDRWSHLPEVFKVAGAEGAYAMLNPILASAYEFSEVLCKAHIEMISTATSDLTNLRRRREQLLERIDKVNSQCEIAASGLSSAESAQSNAYAAYQSEFPLGDASEGYMSPRYWQLSERLWNANSEVEVAEASLGGAQAAAEELREDIARFRRDVEASEEELADALTRVVGGDTVMSSRNQEVRTSQMFWGESSQTYPGGPSVQRGLAESFRGELSRAIAQRISWLASGSPSDVAEWVRTHPDFPAAVGFVDPVVASGLWRHLRNQSRPTGTHGWSGGPLQQLYALAPFAIGNLNGVPSKVRDNFNRATLQQLLDSDALSGNQRGKLEALRAQLDAADDGSDSKLLLSLFLETDDGSPRASLGLGDVDNADLIVTLSHGISNDMGSLGSWTEIAKDLMGATRAQMDKVNVSGSVAMVLFFEWDSGDATNVFGIERPDAGAERLGALLRGLSHANPNAVMNLGVHSLGTTMGTQMLADNPGLVDSAHLYGSAGVSQDATGRLTEQIKEGTLNLSATHATADLIAPMGRWLGSEHSVNPLDSGSGIAGIKEFGSDGGAVPGYGTSPEDEVGIPTGGHDVGETDLLIFTETDMWGNYQYEKGGGYLDPRSESFKHTVMDYVDAVSSSLGTE